MAENRRYSIFISHSTKDKAFAEKLRAYLKENSVDAWLDNYEIIKGQSIPKRIEDGITNSDYFGLVLTPLAISSPWVDHEIDIALYIWIQEIHRERVFIIPMIREDCKPRKSICYIAYCDFRDDEQFVSRCQELLEAIYYGGTGSVLKAGQNSYNSPTDIEAVFKLNLLTLLKFKPTAYIPRKVISSAHRKQYQNLVSKELEEDLLNVILRSKRVILLAEAGKGKTLEIERIVYQLATGDLPFIPVFGFLNKYIDQSLDSYIPDIKRFDDEKLVLLLDGFDEIPSAHREKAIKNIGEFAEQHPNSRIVLSSRTNLYQDIHGFEVYHLADLRGDGIKTYLKTILGKSAIIFENAVGKAGLRDWLHHPFYLARLVELYIQTGAIPESTIQLIEALIDLHLAKDDEKFPGSDERRLIIVKACEHLALTMEILARNYISDEEFQTLISNEANHAVLLRSGLLRKVEGEFVTWQFEHNSFQEFIAARVLSRHDLNIIKKVTAFAPDFAKIKPSWSNTLAFIFSQLAANRDVLTAFLQWMKMTAPDLIVKFEPDRIDLSQRMEVFASIFNDYKAKRILIRRNEYSAGDLGRFADSKEAVEFLLHQAGTTNDSTVLVDIVDILRFMTIPYDLHKKVLKLLMNIITIGDKDPHLTAHGLLALADLGFISKDVIKQVVGLLRDSDETWIRSFLYYYIYTGMFVDDYVDIFLEGLKYVRIMIQEKDVRLGDESYHLKEGLETVTDPAAIEKVIMFFADNPHEIQDTFMTDALMKIVENAAIAFNHNGSIYDTTLRLFIVLQSEHQEKEAEIVRRFFDLTATRKMAFVNIFASRKDDPDWYIPVASILDEETAQIVVDEFIAGRLPADDIWRIRNFIGWQNRLMYDRFLEIVNKRTGNQFILPPQRDYETERKKKFQHDIELLFERDRFLEAIKTIYLTEGKDIISEEDLHQLRRKRWDNPYFSELALQTLTEMVRVNPKGFDKVQEIILKSDWEFFAFSKVHYFMSSNRSMELTIDQKAKIEKWCLDNLTKSGFPEGINEKRKQSCYWR